MIESEVEELSLKLVLNERLSDTEVLKLRDALSLRLVLKDWLSLKLVLNDADSLGLRLVVAESLKLSEVEVLLLNDVLIEALAL